MKSVIIGSYIRNIFCYKYFVFFLLCCSKCKVKVPIEISGRALSFRRSVRRLRQSSTYTRFQASLPYKHRPSHRNIRRIRSSPPATRTRPLCARCTQEEKNIIGMAYFFASSSITSAVRACARAGEDDPPPEEAVLLVEATSFRGFAPFLMRAENFCIPSILGDAWRAGCVWLGVSTGAKAPRNDVKMWRNGGHVVSNEPSCAVPS